MLFTVKTYLQALTEMHAEDLGDLAMEIRSWPTEVATYKGRDRWGNCVLQFCDAKVQRYSGVVKDTPDTVRSTSVRTSRRNSRLP